MGEEEFHIRRTAYQKIQEAIKSKMTLKTDTLERILERISEKPSEESFHEVQTKNDIYDIEIWNILYSLYEKAFKLGYKKCKEDVKESLSYLKGD